MIGFGQSKKELKSLISIKNDSIRVFLSKINEIENTVNVLNTQLDTDKEVISELSEKNDKLHRKLDSIMSSMNSKRNNDTVLLCALTISEYTDTITKNKWGELLETKYWAYITKDLMFYNCEPFTGVAVSYFPDGKLEKAIRFEFGQKSELFREWYNSGQIHKEGSYIQGTRLTISWWGTWKIWYDNGQLATTWDGHSQGTPGGLSIPHHPTGWECWDKEGNIIECTELELPNKSTYILPMKSYKDQFGYQYVDDGYDAY